MTNIIFPTGVPAATPATGDSFMFSDASDSNKLKDATLADLPVSTATTTAIDAKVSDTAYASGWNGETTVAPSKNAVYDKIETLPTASFTTIAVSGQSDVVADSATDTLTLVAGSNIAITTSAGGDSVTITGTGPGTGDVVGPSSATDNAVVRFDSTTGKLVQNSAVTIADTTGDITGGKYNTVTISGSSTPTLAVTGTTAVSGTNTGDQNLFSTIAVSGQSNVVADSTTDTLTLVAGSNVTITTDASTDSITINSTASGTGDVVGPASATDNAVVRFDSTTGKLVQDSAVTIADTTGDITAGKYNTVTISGSSTPTLAVTGTTTVSGANTGDQTITLTGAVTGSGTGSFATTIATPGTVTVSSTNSTATAHTHAVTSSSAPGAAASLLATDSSGHIGSTGTRIVKGWFTDITATNAIAGSITGNAATVTTNANLTGHVTSVGNAAVLGSFTKAQLNTAVSDGDVMYLDSTDTITAVKTFSSAPVFNALPTGTAVASAATASTIATRDANGNLTAANHIGGFRTQATAAGTTTLVVGDAFTQEFTGSTTQTCKLPTTSVAAGQQYLIINNSTGAVTVQSSGSNTIVILGAATSGLFTALIATPTTAANWDYVYNGTTVASGKVATINNTITLAGTDATTMTFPTTSATIARTDAANTFTGASTASAWVLTSPTITTSIVPTSNDGAAVGSTSNQFSDLFLAEGGVINWDNGDATITQTGNDITVGGITTFGVGTSTALTTGTIELGHASDTTVSRSSAGVLAVEGVVIPSISSTNTLTNKRVTKRAPSVTQSATPTINTDNTDVAHITGLAQAITSMSTNLSGTPVEGDMLRIDITDNGTARAITWGSSFEASTVALPTTTVISTRLDVVFVWNTVTSKWRCVGVS